MRAKTAVLAAVSMIVALDGARAQSVDRARPREYRPREQAPSVSVWIDRFSYRPGQRLRAFFQSDPGAYVTVLRISTSGELRVLYPRTPSMQQQYRMDRLVDDEVPYSTDLGFYLNEPEGVGFVFAIASFEPFDYRSVTSAGRWNTYQLTTTGYTDPYEVVTRFIDRTLSYADYSTDFIQYQIAGTLYRPRRYGYASYDDIYYRCLSVYRRRADYYCQQYADFGYAGYTPYIPIVIGRRPTPTPGPGTPGKAKPALPKKLVPDPVVREEGIKPQTPTQRSSSNAEAQRAWWNAQRREAAKTGGGKVVDGVPRVDPQSPAPSEYRNLPSQPRINVRPEPMYEPMRQRRSEPSNQPSYDPAPQHRFEPPVQRNEPVQRSDPQPRYTPEPRVIAAPPSPPPVYRADPAPREFHPAPPPPPPPPPPPAPVDRGDPAPRTLPSPPPPPPPPV